MELTRGEAYDQGLRNYMTSIFNWMILGVLISAGGAWLGIQSGLPAWFAAHSGYFLIAVLAPLGIIVAMGMGMQNASVGALRIGYLAIALIEGLVITVILSKYSPTSVMVVFMATSASFAGLSLWGYTTGKNLSGWGNFLIAALWGLIAVMLIQMFVQIPGMSMLISIAGVLIFSGLIAYDTQTLKGMYRLTDDAEEQNRIVLWGAVTLYLDFINLFLHLLQLLGQKDD